MAFWARSRPAAVWVLQSSTGQWFYPSGLRVTALGRVGTSTPVAVVFLPCLSAGMEKNVVMLVVVARKLFSQKLPSGPLGRGRWEANGRCGGTRAWCRSRWACCWALPRRVWGCHPTPPRRVSPLHLLGCPPGPQHHAEELLLSGDVLGGGRNAACGWRRQRAGGQHHSAQVLGQWRKQKGRAT